MFWVDSLGAGLGRVTMRYVSLFLGVCQSGIGS
jgi:hypothetical protein